jgi:UDP-N-acetylmuramate--L-alanine ligase/UDP-N-acetylenolpyruvoylglucosamine reductase
MLGVCGVGMAGVAYLLARRGWSVSGCDSHVNPLAAWLRQCGVPVDDRHDVAHLDAAQPRDRVIVTPAVSENEPELALARAKGLSVFHRGEVLATLMSQSRGVAVCGAHGKTTTTCFTTRLLKALGASPSWCIGGTTPQLAHVAGCGTGDLLVAEADESDGTLALYHPAVTVLNNIDLDHLEHFDGEAALCACFGRAVAQTREGVAVCRDNARAWRVAQGASVPVLDFGFSVEATLRAYKVTVTPSSVSFDVAYRGTPMGRLTLGVSGRHNALNALGAASAALLLGYAPDAVFAALPQVCDELPGRRFEAVFDAGGIRCIADYAHHPTELQAAVEMAKVQNPARLLVVFQPHRYTRTLALGREFPKAFASADEVILLPVYAASEAPIEGGDICDLYARFREAAHEGVPGGHALPVVRLARSREEAWGYLRQELKAGDLLLIAGAGDVIELADLIHADAAQGWPARRDPEGFEAELGRIDGARVTPFGALSGWCFFGVGGRARWRVEVSTEAALCGVTRACEAHGVAWRLVGAGANAWFSDLGEPGCVIRFSDGAFRGFERRGDAVEVGCGWRGPALLDALEREGLSGLEFLEGVPGSVGGWLAMNAGAQGGEIASRVEWIRCLNPDGKIAILPAHDVGFSYRCCKGLEKRVALACGLRLVPAETAAIQALRQRMRAKRIPLAGLRTEGSVFRNPPGNAAGRLLEAAGCKGWRVGGARVTDFHANIVAVEGGAATASDVLALVMRMRNRVAKAGGVVLRPEIDGLFLKEASD